MEQYNITLNEDKQKLEKTINTIVVFTNNQKWGKGGSLNEALKNAQWKRGQEIYASAFNCCQTKISVSDMGSVIRPTDATEIFLTNGEYVKL